jgi:NADPH-dependent curcumin reductase CurA
MPANRQIVLQSLPQGKLTPDTFRLVTGEAPSPRDGEVLVRTRMISLDAANRAWMAGATYRSALEPGQVMAGGSISEVVESKADGFAPGDLVWADAGWQDYAALPAKTLTKQPRLEPISHLISVYGVAGLTAYFGLLEVGQAKAGETVVVSAAAGGVGSIVGQIARIKGCKVVGVAGGAAKCALLTDKLGYDRTVDYKAGDLHQQIKAACPDGVDVYFDNVGGEVLEAVMFNMRYGGRIACCGSAASYDTDTPKPSPRGIPGLLVIRSLTLKGFLVMDYYAKRDQALADLKSWVESGQLKPVEDVIEGLENLPSALIGLLAGDNIGKRMVRV